MAMTATQKILAAHAGLREVHAGQLINATLDLVLSNDITAPVAVNEFHKAGFERVFDPSKVVFVLDHFTPNKDIKSAQNCKQLRIFAKEHGIGHFYDVGAMGIEHVLLPEKGLAAPGDLIIGADSHTCTYGALGAFSTGVGSTDAAAGIATGNAWFKVPSAIKVVLTGKPNEDVSGKDVILHLIGLIGVDGARYRSLEFFGDGIQYLSMDDRLCIANMAIECGAKNGIFPVDDVTKTYLKERVSRPYTAYEADADAEYDETIEINLSTLRPTASFPHLPSNTHTIDEIKTQFGKIAIDQAVIGSCTNGRMEDMRIAAAILKNKKTAPGVRVIVIPGSQEVYLGCVREGLAEIFVSAGAAFSTPTCGPCLGGHMGILADGEKCVSTTNRNFVGRMGHTESEVYLASPAVAAYSALRGYICGKEEF
ncbi:MAG: 3-isopropylmalate dehydratase large subunit [Oscillospiraceae bacterium]|nr:3-isopropylmalate dehydratase large subunit [Oscillospiraceae bacterium]